MHEILVGLNVTNDDGYREYRKRMKPVLASMGGGFRYDFRVSEVCKTDLSNEYKDQISETINRVFVIYFPDTGVREKFFNDANYLDIRRKHFEPAVENTVILAEWDSNI